MNDKLNTLLDEIRNRIDQAENTKQPYDFIQARLKVQEAKELIKSMKEDNNE